MKAVEQLQKILERRLPELQVSAAAKELDDGMTSVLRSVQSFQGLAGDLADTPGPAQQEAKILVKEMDKVEQAVIKAGTQVDRVTAKLK